MNQKSTKKNLKNLPSNTKTINAPTISGRNPPKPKRVNTSRLNSKLINSERGFQEQYPPQYPEEPEPSFQRKNQSFSRSGRQPPRPPSKRETQDYEQNYSQRIPPQNPYNDNFTRTKSATNDSRMDRQPMDYNHSQSYDPRYEDRR